jgi:hypothetical protein
MSATARYPSSLLPKADHDPELLELMKNPVTKEQISTSFPYFTLLHLFPLSFPLLPLLTAPFRSLSPHRCQSLLRHRRRQAYVLAPFPSYDADQDDDQRYPRRLSVLAFRR